MAAPRERIRIEYQGRPCIAGQMQRSTGMLPDRGWVTMLAGQLGDLSLQTRVRGFLKMSDNATIAMPHHMRVVLKKLQQKTQVITQTPPPTPPGEPPELAGRLLFDPNPGAGQDEPPGEVILDHIYIDRQGITEDDQEAAEFDDPNNIVRVALTDIRAWWRDPGGLLWGEYNVRLPNGDYDPSTIKETGEPFSLAEFVRFCLVALPGSPILEPDSVIIEQAAAFEAPQAKIYRYTSAFDALKELLDENGLTIVLTHEGSVRVVPAFAQHEPFRFRQSREAEVVPGAAAKFIVLPRESTIAAKASSHSFPPAAVMVVGGPNWEVVDAYTEPVYQSPTTGEIREFNNDNLDEDFNGYTVEQAAVQALKTDQFQYDDIPADGPQELEDLRRIAKAWFYRGYRKTRVAGLAPQNSTNLSELPFGPYLERQGFVAGIAVGGVPTLQLGELTMRDPQVFGSTYRQVHHPDPEGVINEISAAAASLTDQVQRLEQIRTFKQDLSDFLDRQKVVRDRNLDQFSAEAKRVFDTELEQLLYEEVVFVHNDRSLQLLQEIERIDDVIARLQTAAQQKIDAVGALSAAYANRKFPKVWLTQPFGLIPDGEYQLVHDQGIILFGRPFGLLSPETEGVMNQDQAVLDLPPFTAPIIRYGAPRNTGKPEDWFSAVFIADPEAPGGIRQVAANAPIDSRPEVIRDRSLQTWFDQRGQPINETEVTGRAKKLAQPVLLRPRVYNGVKYEAEGFWPFETSEDVKSIVWSSKTGDDARTLAAANVDNEDLDGFPSIQKKNTITAWEDVVRLPRRLRPQPEERFNHIAP